MNDPQQPNDFSPKPGVPVDNTAPYHKRFLAFAIDVFLLLIVMTFLMRYLGLEPASSNDMQAMQAEIVAKLKLLSDSDKMLLAFSPYLTFFALHGLSLYQRGQTLGKRMMRIAIVTLDNQKPAFFPLIGQRYVSQWIIGMVPVAGPVLRIADVLLIFRADKRCFHDLIAKTKVIDLSVQIEAAPNSFIA